MTGMPFKFYLSVLVSLLLLYLKEFTELSSASKVCGFKLH